MEKTTIETMKSVIQDWLAECNTIDELTATFGTLYRHLEEQYWAISFELTEGRKQ